MFHVYISLENSSTIFTLIYSLFYPPLALVSSPWSCVTNKKLNTCVLFPKYVNIYKDGYINEWIRIFTNEIDKCKLSNLIVFWLKYCYNSVSQLIVIPFPKFLFSQLIVIHFPNEEFVNVYLQYVLWFKFYLIWITLTP
jgi:hypothetical protein